MKGRPGGDASWSVGPLVRAMLLGAGLLPAALAVLLLGQALQEGQGFPHEEHEGLFPLCTGCHEGIEAGTPPAFYPEPESCVGCHDGVDVARVVWTGPTPEPSNLVFDHAAHVAEVAARGDSALACQGCHATPGAARMTVEPLEAETCLTCHGEPPADHLLNQGCEACHEPLATSGLPLARIAATPVPADHESGAFVREAHGEWVVEQPARCATCHTRERCLACHLDVEREELALLPVAPASMELPPAAVHYPLPLTHESPDFEREHGVLAGAGAMQSCGTCHTREDCASCHLSPLPDEATELARRGTVPAPGVGLVEDAPEGHEAPFFLRAHGPSAASDPAGCASCHTQPFCSDCHQAAQRPVFHDQDYVAGHAADAWGQNAECASCHNVQVFCRSCHVQSGFAAQGRLGPGFHDAEPLWLLRHGQAARQSLESCSSCHRQRECLQCHSQAGSYRVNPHGPGFDARRAWERNPLICTACHLSSPFGGAGP